MCLEGLGQPRAGSLLPVLRGAGPLGDQHEEKKVAVVLQWRGAESQLCTEGGPRRTHSDRRPVCSEQGEASHQGGAGRGRGSAIRPEPQAVHSNDAPLQKKLRHEKSVIPKII